MSPLPFVRAIRGAHGLPHSWQTSVAWVPLGIDRRPAWIQPQIHTFDMPGIIDDKGLFVQSSIVHETVVLVSLLQRRPGMWESAKGGGCLEAFSNSPSGHFPGHFPFSTHSILRCPLKVVAHG